MLRAVRNLAHPCAVVVFFVGLYGVFFAPVLLTGRLLAPGDASNFHLPHFYSAHSLWCPWLSSGFPALGDPQTMMWYPLARIFCLLPNSWNAFVVAAYVLASCFTYGYVHLVTGSRLAALVGGAIYGMSGFFMAHLGHTSIIHSAAWIPLLLWALERLRHELTARWLLLGGLAAGNCLLAGHPQFFVYGLCLAAAYVVWRGRGAASGAVRYGAASLGIVVLGLGLAAVTLLPTIELQAHSFRAEITFADFVSFSLPVRQLPQLLFPYLYGGYCNPLDGSRVPYTGPLLPGLTEGTGYVGLLPLVLAGLGFWLLRRQPLARFWLAVAVLTVLLSLGKRFPLNPLLYHLPVYNKFRIPARHFAELALAVSVLAGFGIATLERLDLERRMRVVRRGSAAAAGLLLAVMARVVYMSARGTATNHPNRFGLPAVSLSWHNPAVLAQLALLTCGLSLLWYWCRRPGWGRGGLLLTVLVLDLGTFGWLYEWHDTTVTPGQFQVPAGLVAYRDRLVQSRQRLLPLLAIGPPQAAPPNRSMLWDMPSALGYGPLALSRYGRFLGTDAVGFSSYHCLDPTDWSLDLLATRYVLAPRGPLPNKGEPRDVSSEMLHDERWCYQADIQGVAVFENRRALPRAWLVPRALSLPPEAILTAVHESRLPDGTPFDPRQLALVEEPFALAEQADPCGRTQVIDLSDGRLDVRTTSSRPAFLVLSDVYYPGWTVTVNGQPAELVRTNYVLRGVKVPAGDHVVRFAFRPFWFYVGATVSGITWLATAALLAWTWVAPRRLCFSSPLTKGGGG